MRPLILAINPSHSAPAESRFWGNIASAANQRGWQLVQVAARSIPDVEFAVTERMPARLWQYANRMRNQPARQLYELPEWLSAADVDRHVDWEHRRWELGLFDPAVIDGLHRLAWYADALVRWLNPAVVLTTNKIDHPCALFRAAAIHCGIPTAIVERSPFDGIWIEPNGLFAESGIWTEAPYADLASYAGHGSNVVEAVIANPAGFRESEASAERPEVAPGNGPVVFLPMDNLLWTAWAQSGHPQGLVDNPMFRTPQEGLDAVAGWAARRGGRVVMKAHPSCIETLFLHRPPNVEVVEGDLAYLIANSDLTVAFNTKVAFVAAALGGRLAVLADNPFAVVPSVAYWRRYRSLDALLDRALEGDPPDRGEVEGLFGWLDERYFYTIDAGPMGPAELVADFIDSAFGVAGGVLDSAEIDELRVRNTGTSQRPEPLPAGAPRLVLDVTRLLDHRSGPSGIGRYCDEMLGRLVGESSIETWALVREPSSGWPIATQQLHMDLRLRTGGRVLYVRSGDSESVIREVLGLLRASDVFHSTHLGLPELGMVGDAQRVLTVHDVLHLKYPNLYDGPQPPTIKRVLDSLDLSADWVITVSDQTRRDLLSILPRSAGRVRTIHLGSTITEGRGLGSDQISAYVLALMQPEPRKNLAGTVAGIAHGLERAHDETRGVVLVVSPRTFEQAREEVRRSKLASERVRYVLSPSDKELSDLYRAADVFVFGSTYEGFGLPPLEALRFGIPTVAVMGSSIIEVLGDAVAYATSGQPEALGDALAFVLELPELRRELSARATLRAAQLSWDRTAALHLDVYAMAAAGVES